MTPLGVEACGESEFDIFKAKKCFPDPGKACVLKRNLIFSTFRFNIQAFLESGKRFFALKMSNSNSRMFLPLEGLFAERIFENFFTWVAGPLLYSSSEFSSVKCFVSMFVGQALQERTRLPKIWKKVAVTVIINLFVNFLDFWSF